MFARKSCSKTPSEQECNQLQKESNQLVRNQSESIPKTLWRRRPSNNGGGDEPDRPCSEY